MAMTPEGRVKAMIKKWLVANGVWYYMPVQNGMGQVGIPDFICCSEGRFFAIEAKAPGKKNTVTANQENVMRQIRDHGGEAWVVDCETDLIALSVTLRLQGVKCAVSA